MTEHIPAAIVTHAKLIRAEGWPVSVLVAMSWLETDRWRSRLWGEAGNPFGIKRAKNDKWQSGHILLGGFEYARYRRLSDAFRDLQRIMNMHASWSPNLTIWELLDTHYSPIQDQKDGKKYSLKVRHLIRQHNLQRFDAEPGEEREIMIEKLPLWLMWAKWAWGLLSELVDLIDEVEGTGSGEQKKQRVLDAIYERWGGQINALPFGVRHAAKALISGVVDWIVDASKTLFGDDWHQPTNVV